MVSKLKLVGVWVAQHGKILLWTLALVAAAVVALFVFRRRGSWQSTTKPSFIDSFQTMAREQIESAETMAEIEKNLAKTRSDLERAQLEEIKKVEEPEERRKALANWLDKNL